MIRTTTTTIITVIVLTVNLLIVAPAVMLVCVGAALAGSVRLQVSEVLLPRPSATTRSSDHYYRFYTQIV